MYKRNRNLPYILFSLTIICILGISYFWGRSPIQACGSWGFSSAAEKYYTHPQKIVVEPWRGEHHVYAIFTIPGGYLNDKLFTFTTSEFGKFCGELDFMGTKVADGVYAQPGYYLMKAMLHTRVALWLMIKGKGDELKNPQKWQVGYTKIGASNR